MLRFVLVLTSLIVASAASAQPMASSVRQHLLKICPTADVPEQCVADFESVAADAEKADKLEAQFRRRFPDPRVGSIEVQNANVAVFLRWTHVADKHDRRWSR